MFRSLTEPWTAVRDGSEAPVACGIGSRGVSGPPLDRRAVLVLPFGLALAGCPAVQETAERRPDILRIDLDVVVSEILPTTALGRNNPLLPKENERLAHGRLDADVLPVGGQAVGVLVLKGLRHPVPSAGSPGRAFDRLASGVSLAVSGHTLSQRPSEWQLDLAASGSAIDPAETTALSNADFIGSEPIRWRGGVSAVEGATFSIPFLAGPGYRTVLRGTLEYMPAHWRR